MSCGVGCRLSSDLALLWLWCRLVALAPIRHLAWELPYAAGVALKKKPKKKRSFPSACAHVTHCSEANKELLVSQAPPPPQPMSPSPLTFSAPEAQDASQILSSPPDPTILLSTLERHNVSAPIFLIMCHSIAMRSREDLFFYDFRTFSGWKDSYLYMLSSV